MGGCESEEKDGAEGDEEEEIEEAVCGVEESVQDTLSRNVSACELSGSDISFVGSLSQSVSSRFLPLSFTVYIIRYLYLSCRRLWSIACIWSSQEFVVSIVCSGVSISLSIFGFSGVYIEIRNAAQSRTRVEQKHRDTFDRALH